MRQQLLQLLTARKGHFRLESGHHGDLWLDLDPLFVQPDRLQPLMAELAKKLAPYGLDAVCGPLVGGTFLAQAVAASLAVEFYYTERLVSAADGGPHSVRYQLPDGLRRQVRGKRIAVVDDVVNAGSAVRGTLAELRSCGAIPVAVGTLLLLGATASDFFVGQGMPVETIAHLPNNLWTPAECPLCAAQVPLEDPLAGR